MTSSNSKKELTLETYQTFISCLEKGDASQKKFVPQYQIAINAKTRQLYSKYQLKAFSNSNFDKRIIIADSSKKTCMYTLPYGYNETLLHQLKQFSKPLNNL